ncbi:MAG: type I restriction endonuclease subunit R [Dermatophilaceae bacterium]
MAEDSGVFDFGGFSEAQWEQVALEALATNEWQPLRGHDIAPGSGERQSWDDPVLPGRVLKAMVRLNPTVPTEHLQEALADILTPKSQDAITENHRVHEFLVNGYRGVSYVDADGTEQNPTVHLLADRAGDNEFLAVNQVTVRHKDHERRFDVVLYVNGLPLAVIELKQAGAARADVAAAHAQLQTYLRELPMAFRFCVLVVASDGLFAKYGTPFTPLHHFSPWNVDADGRPVELGHPEGDDYLGTGLELLIDGVFNIERFLQLLRDFTAYDSSEAGLAKRIAKPHQYFAVTKAVGSTIDAVRSNGQAGVVWHTQGSGKSMEMELYAARVMRHPVLLNPTVVVITDRNELDGQLFQSFKRSQLLPEQPTQITTRSQLRRELTSRVTGGLYFTTLQKFGLSQSERESGVEHPLLSDRRNVIVIVDEAHRSHYDNLDGYARHLRDALPHATLIAFTGTPISFADRNTRAVFGDYVDIYDLSRAVADGATVPVYFEPRLIKVGLAKGVSQEDIDKAADEAAAGLVDLAERERIERSVAVLNAIYGAPDRLTKLAADLVAHWENRRAQMVQFVEAPGKAMVVGATREICARLYAEIVALRPDWHADALDKGRIKVVYSGSPQDPPAIAEHVRRESENEVVKQRLREVDDELEIVIVKDMMLTGYDSQPLHTLYVDRPLKGALLMQTLARVNRTFRGKPAGLLVAYAPLVENLNQALAEYTPSDQTTRPMGRTIDEAVALTEQLVEALRTVCSGYGWTKRLTGAPKAWTEAAVGMTAYLRSPQTPGNQAGEGKETLGMRFRTLSAQLARAWAISSGSETLARLRGEVRFYEEVRIYMAKWDADERRSRGEPVPEQLQRLLSKLVAESTESGEIVDIYQAAGLPKPSLMELSPDFAQQALRAKNPHLAIEALRGLLTEEAGHVARANLVRQRAFSQRLTELMTKYTNQQLTSAEVIAALVEMAKEIAAERDRGKAFAPPLTDDQLAFYDALSAKQSAGEVMTDDVLARIARELVDVMRRDVKTDWTVRDDVRAKLRSQVKRLLVKHHYPPDQQPEAIILVIEQMEALAPRMAA